MPETPAEFLNRYGKTPLDVCTDSQGRNYIYDQEFRRHYFPDELQNQKPKT